MLPSRVKLHDDAKSRAKFFGNLLDNFYAELMVVGIPEHLAGLVRKIKEQEFAAADGRKLALVVEADNDSRSLAISLLSETDLSIISRNGLLSETDSNTGNWWMPK